MIQGFGTPITPSIKNESPRKKSNPLLTRIRSYKSEKGLNEHDSRRLSKSLGTPLHIDYDSHPIEKLHEVINQNVYKDLSSDKKNEWIRYLEELPLDKLHPLIINSPIFFYLTDEMKVKWGIYLFHQGNKIETHSFKNYFNNENEIKNIINIFKELSIKDKKKLLKLIDFSLTIHLINLCTIKEIHFILKLCKDFQQLEMLYDLLNHENQNQLFTYYDIRLFSDNIQFIQRLKEKNLLILTLFIKKNYISNDFKLHFLLCKREVFLNQHLYFKYISDFFKPFHWAKLLPDLNIKTIIYCRNNHLLTQENEILAYSLMKKSEFEKLIQEKKLPQWMNTSTIFAIMEEKNNRIFLKNEFTKYYEIHENTQEQLSQLKEKINQLEDKLNKILNFFETTNAQ